MHDLIGIKFHKYILILKYHTDLFSSEFGLLPEGKPTLKQAQLFYDFAQEIYLMVKNHLESRA